MITEEEMNDLKKTGFSFFSSFILIPAITILCNLVGFISKVSIGIILVVFLLSFISYIRRFWFLKKHRRFITDKQWRFQNISYAILMTWNLFASFLPYYDGDEETIEYHLVGNINILLWLPIIIFSFVLFTFMVITAKNVAGQVSKAMKEKKSTY